MRQPLLVFGLVSAASASVFEAIDCSLGAMIGLIVALEAGADGLYVTTHQLIRVLAMGVCIPLFASYWSRS